LLGDELPVLTYLKKCVCSYLDDILIFSITEEEHYAHFPRLWHGLDGMVSKQKCDFFKAELKLLGSIVSAYGMKPLVVITRIVLKFAWFKDPGPFKDTAYML
jgi:hypothetical protein